MTMKTSFYLESSAAIKLFELEQETQPLRTFLERLAPDSNLITSSLTRLEVLGNLTSEGRVSARQFFQEVSIVPLKQSILDDALLAMAFGLKTLDAIHYATAQRLGPNLRAVISYDKKLSRAFTETGVQVISPAD
jgi:uncharacterized protein